MSTTETTTTTTTWNGLSSSLFLLHSPSLWMRIDAFVIDKASIMQHFPFKKVTVAEDLVRNWPAADRSERIPKLFQHSAAVPSLFPVFSGPSTDVDPSGPSPLPVSVSEEVDAVRRSGEEKFRGGKTCGVMPERLHPSLQSSASKVASVS